MRRYAQDTEVSQESSRQEIERTLTRYGADAFMYGWEGTQAVLAFRMRDRHIKFVLPMPDRTDFATYEKVSNQYGRKHKIARSPEQQFKAWEQACRSRWRSLALVIKAKLEAVASGITVLEDEFMAHIVMPDGRTVGEHARPAIATAYNTGKMPKLLPGPATS